MTAQEFEQFLHDAEIKLARLKALYEQWFQGIERTEPVIVRKDLDRTLEMLKKNMPRNTALRFRTQQLSARYGTYGIYWGRIGRQIEEGTYKRVLARASRTMGSANANAKAPESGWEIEVDVDEVETGATGVDFSDGDLDAILGALTTEEEKPKTKPTRSLSPFGFGAGLAPSRPPGAATPGSVTTNSVTPGAATFGKPVDSGPKPPAATPVTATMAKPKDSPGAMPSALPASTKATPLVPAAAPQRVPPVANVVSGAPIARPPAPVPVSRPPAPAPLTAPVPVSRPAAPPVAKPAAPPAKPAAPAAPPAPAARPLAPPAAATAPSGVRPAPAPAAARPAPAPAPAAKPAAAAPAASSSLDESRMRAIHASYVDARRRNNEGADVRFETLAESVQKLIPKLREKHGGKAIDFEVVLQNGKVGLKPKVSG